MDSNPNDPQKFPIDKTHEDKTAFAAAPTHFERLFTMSIGPACVAGFDGYFKMVNPAFSKALGFTAAELTSRPYLEFVHPEDQNKTTVEADHIEGGGISQHFENRYRCKDGSYRWLEWRAFPHPEENLIYGMAQDVTRRKDVEARLREVEERYQLLVGKIEEYAIFMLDPDGNILTWNAGAQRLNGYTPQEIIGKHFSTFYSPEDKADGKPERELKIASETGTYFEEGWRIRKDGSRFFASVTITALKNSQGILVGFAKITQDITEQNKAKLAIQEKNDQLEKSILSEQRAMHALKEAQSRLVQSEKLAALGQLVAGVAHEINNPLAFVINNLAVLKRDVGLIWDLLTMYGRGEPMLATHAKELAQEISDFSQRIDLKYTGEEIESLLLRSGDGLARIQQIVRDLRDFARHDALGDVQDDADINAGIKSTLNIVQGRAAKTGTKLNLDLGNLTPVNCRPSKINQVVLNLLLNAIDACEPSKGVVTVRTRINGENLELSIIDNGSGIDPAILDRIFDPFFTTKPQGQGTGLGLSISHGIITDHGGTISVQSKQGEGTTFTIQIPAKKI